MELFPSLTVYVVDKNEILGGETGNMPIKRFPPIGGPEPFRSIDRIDEVRARVDALLPRDDKGVLPLCFTIEEQIQNRLRDLDPELIRIILRELTVGTMYLERIRTDKWRYALNGEPVERIERYQREFATGVLALREAWERAQRPK